MLPIPLAHINSKQKQFLKSIESSKFKKLLQTAGTVINSVVEAAEAENYHKKHSNVDYGECHPCQEFYNRYECENNYYMV